MREFLNSCVYDVEDVETFLNNFLQYNQGEVDSVDFSFRKREILAQSNNVITTEITIHKAIFETDEE